MTEAYWQPIETAPKDGTPILALVDNDKVTVIVWDGFFSEWSLSVGHQYCLDVTGWYGLPSISKPPKTEREQIVEEVWESIVITIDPESEAEKEKAAEKKVGRFLRFMLIHPRYDEAMKSGWTREDIDKIQEKVNNEIT